MHVSEPIPKRKLAKRSKKSRRPAIFGILIVLILGGYLLTFHTNSGKRILGQQTDSDKASSSSTDSPMKFLSGYDFQSLYEHSAFPNTAKSPQVQQITGNVALDARIVQIAESRGYKRQAQPVQPLEDLQAQKETVLLQPLAQEALKQLETQARADNVPLTVRVGYRSYEEQKILFLRQLGLSGVNVSQTVDSSIDTRLLQAIESVAPPGYSRLQTGYAVVLGCSNTSGLFRSSTCNTWLKANNYSKAKRTGFIPSHSEGVGSPDSQDETEYVWVGTAKLY